jgi:hypothetical protein
MADRNKKVVKKASPKKITAKRRTAIPVSAARAVRAVEKTPIMRVVARPVEEVVLARVEPSHEMIARRAFENWSFYLRLANDPVQNWLEAERQLRGEMNLE